MQNIRKSRTRDSFFKLSKKNVIERNLQQNSTGTYGGLDRKIPHTHANKGARHRTKFYPIALYAFTKTHAKFEKLSKNV